MRARRRNPEVVPGRVRSDRRSNRAQQHDGLLNRPRVCQSDGAQRGGGRPPKPLVPTAGRGLEAQVSDQHPRIDRLVGQHLIQAMSKRLLAQQPIGVRGVQHPREDGKVIVRTGRRYASVMLPGRACSKSAAEITACPDFGSRVEFSTPRLAVAAGPRSIQAPAIAAAACRACPKGAMPPGALLRPVACVGDRAPAPALRARCASQELCAWTSRGNNGLPLKPETCAHANEPGPCGHGRVPSKTDTSFESVLATTRSRCPSALRSPIATDTG